MAKNKINKIKIKDPFERIVTVIDKNDYSYNDIDIKEDLEIVDVMTRKVILVIFRGNDYFALSVVVPSPMFCGCKVGLRKSW